MVGAHLMTSVAGTTMSRALLKSPDAPEGGISDTVPFTCKLEASRACCFCTVCSSSTIPSSPLPWHIVLAGLGFLLHGEQEREGCSPLLGHLFG